MMERSGQGEDRWGYGVAGAGHHRWLPMWRTNVVLQILHSASGCVQDDKRQASFRMGQQTANKPHLYLVKRQVATKEGTEKDAL